MQHYGEYRGWICPVCGAGVSPKVAEHCNIISNGLDINGGDSRSSIGTDKTAEKGVIKMLRGRVNEPKFSEKYSDERAVSGSEMHKSPENVIRCEACDD